MSQRDIMVFFCYLCDTVVSHRCRTWHCEDVVLILCDIHHVFRGNNEASASARSVGLLRTRESLWNWFEVYFLRDSLLRNRDVQVCGDRMICYRGIRLLLDTRDGFMRDYATLITINKVTVHF